MVKRSNTARAVRRDRIRARLLAAARHWYQLPVAATRMQGSRRGLHQLMRNIAGQRADALIGGFTAIIWNALYRPTMG